LSSAQKKELHAVTTNDDRNIVRRTLRPQEGPDISRRMFVFGGLATGLGIQAVRKYNQSVDKIDKASGAPPSKKEMPEGDLDFFDRPDPRTVVQSEASKSLVAAAKVDQQWAAGYAVGGGVVAIPAIISAAKLALGVDKTRFRGEVSSLMARMDHVVGAVKNEIRAQDHGVA
ncbi:MAG: hypothetical protein EBV03_06475, partial [Proteobacteria bacterium]|nr:hypothetical protein [Pseudomonadota bacterium]